MEILVVAHQYPPSTGGMQKQCYELVTHLEKNYTVHKHIYQSVGNKVWFFLTAAKRVLNFLKSHPETRLIYINDLIMLLFLTPILKKIKIPVIVTVHGLDVVYPNTFYQRWLKKNLKKLSAIVPVSFQTGEELMKRGVQKEIIFPVKNGVSLDPIQQFTTKEIDETLKKFGLKQYKKIILSIGRPVVRKGFSWFGENIVPHLDSSTAYVIVGPKLENPKLYRTLLNIPGLKKIIQRIFLLGVPTDDLKIETLQKKYSNIVRLSNLSNKELKMLLQYADLFVMPNIKVHGDYEGFGLVTLEAASSKTICLAANVDGIPSAITHKKNGELLKSADVELWKARVIELLKDDQQRESLAQEYKIYTDANCSSWQDMASEYVDVFKKIISY
ncbi:MAG TPA: glycosyltransferase family 4 protein [Oligoflexia bacterium]|nr:glycosyltransferase family 4 protein [Oligoflexia bacterium]HMR24446.1 glycosyltransferase family 4 protein [Oligoflexia bacterium]